MANNRSSRREGEATRRTGPGLGVVGAAADAVRRRRRGQVAKARGKCCSGGGAAAVLRRAGGKAGPQAWAAAGAGTTVGCGGARCARARRHSRSNTDEGRGRDQASVMAAGARGCGSYDNKSEGGKGGMGAAHRGEGDGELGMVRGGPEVADRRGGADVHGRGGGVDGGGSGSLQQEPVAVENDDEGDRLVGSFWHRGEAPVHGIDCELVTAS